MAGIVGAACHANAGSVTRRTALRDRRSVQVSPRCAENALCGRGCRRRRARRPRRTESNPRAPCPSLLSATLLDADALERLRELDPTGKSRLLERVLRAFQSSASRLAQQFGEARKSGDMQASATSCTP